MGCWYLLINEGLGAWRKPSGIEGPESAVDVSKVTRPHVLTSIDSESSHTQINQFIQIFRYFSSNIVLLQGQIQEIHQATVPDLSTPNQRDGVNNKNMSWRVHTRVKNTAANKNLENIIVVFNLFFGSFAFVIIEVPWWVGNSREVLLAGVEVWSTAGVSALSTSGSTHVINHCIHIYVHLHDGTVTQKEMLHSYQLHWSIVIWLFLRYDTMSFSFVLPQHYYSVWSCPSALPQFLIWSTSCS